MLNKFADKIGAGGVLLAALSCAACFPALGALASALGLGFLASFEGTAVNILLPTFAIVALLANLFSWYQHKRILRGLLSISGPVAVLLTLYPLWQYGWSTYLFYLGICIMLITSILDIVKPARAPTCKISN